MTEETIQATQNELVKDNSDNVSQETENLTSQPDVKQAETSEQTQQVKEGQQQNNVSSDEVDSMGVPWKNRYAEVRRKLDKIEKEIDEMKYRNTSAPTQYIQPQAIEEDEFVKQQRQIAQQELQRERAADIEMNRILNKIEQEYPYVKGFRNDIQQEVQGLSWNLRSNEYAVNKIVDSWIGAKAKRGELNQPNTAKAQTKTPETPKKLVDVKDVLVPQGSMNIGEDNLTDEEKDFAGRLQLYGKGFTKKEIREMYKKNEERQKGKVKK